MVLLENWRVLILYGLQEVGLGPLFADDNCISA